MTESPRVDAALPPVPTGTHPWVAQWQDRIGFGVSIFPQPPDWQGFIRLVQRMEAMGIDSYWSYDHPAANADCWTALAALAVSTERIRLGTMVDCIYYRSPYLLARQAADVDRASGGRLVLGLGIGRLEEEFAVMGLSFPPTPDAAAGTGGDLRHSARVMVWGAVQLPRREFLRRDSGTVGGLPAAGAGAVRPLPAGRRRREDDAAPGGAVRRRLQHGRSPGHRSGRLGRRHRPQVHAP